ncbi:LuxR C-terminal-related transcriptional regulator [Candidatus Brocadia sinica]
MARLNISEPSVKKYMNGIYKKVGVANRLQLALYAMEHWPSYFKVT